MNTVETDDRRVVNNDDDSGVCMHVGQEKQVRNKRLVKLNQVVEDLKYLMLLDS